MNQIYQIATERALLETNISLHDLEIIPGHGPEAVFWIVVDALLLVAIVTGNSLSVAIILRTSRRRQFNKNSTIPDLTHTSHSISAIYKQNACQEMGKHGLEHERNVPDITTNNITKSGARSSYRFVLSLAISDLLVGLSMPFHMTFYIQGADGGGSPLKLEEEAITLGQIQWTCLLRFVLIALACSASACNLIAIAVDRYIAIVYPLHYCRYMTKKVAITMIVSCWGTSLIFATIPAYWNRWATASLCELEEIFTPEYLTYVVAPLFGAVVIALSVLYWRIGKEARAQLSKLLGADGGGPPWRRCQSGKTYSSSINAPGQDRDKNILIIQQNTRSDISKNEPMMLHENIVTKATTDITNKTTQKSSKNFGDKSADYKENQLEDCRVNTLQNPLKAYQDCNALRTERMSNHNAFLRTNLANNEVSQFSDHKFLKIQPHQNPESNVRVLNSNLKITGKIFKCQSDSNIAIRLKEEKLINKKTSLKEIFGSNNEITVYENMTEYKIITPSCNLSLLNKFSNEIKAKTAKNIRCNSMIKCTSSPNHLSDMKESLNPCNNKSDDYSENISRNNFERSSSVFIEMKNCPQSDKKQSVKENGISIAYNNFHTEPNVLKNHTEKQNEKEPIISGENLLREVATAENGPKVDLQNKEILCNFTDITPSNQTSVKSSNLDKRRNSKQESKENMQELSTNINTQTNEEKCKDCTINGCCGCYDNQENKTDMENYDNENFDKSKSKEFHSNQHCTPRARSISTSSSNNGDHRNSNWNIRFSSLTSGSTSIRPHISKSTIVVLLVLGSFILLWLPYITVCTLLVKKVKLPYTIYRITFSLAMSNSAVNPIVYGWKNAELKRAFLRFILNKWYLCKSKWNINGEEQVQNVGAVNDPFDITESSCIS